MKEGSVSFKAVEKDVVSSDMDVFYNPVMKLNRDFTVLFCKLLREDARVAFPLAGSGVRALRSLKEASEEFRLYVNDKREGFEKDFMTSLENNDLVSKSITIRSTEANKFLNSEYSFDFIDIDPYGSPNFLLDSSIRKLRHDGFLSVTATDTAPLCGSYANACKRKYWSLPLRNHEMHEVGIRILIRKIQLIGLQYEKALLPVLSFSKDHYFKVVLQCDHRKSSCNAVMKEHGMYKEAGPMWKGDLYDKKILDRLELNEYMDDTQVFLDVLRNELDVLGMFDVHELASELKLSTMPKMDVLLPEVDGRRTHFRLTGFKSRLSKEKVVKKMKELR